MNFLIALSGLIFPGLGHALLGKRGRAAVFFVLLSAMFYAGVFLEREFYYKFGDGMLVSQPRDTIPIRDHRPDELEGNVELKERSAADVALVPVADVVRRITERVLELGGELGK